MKNHIEDDIKHLQNKLKELSTKSKRFFCNKKEVEREFLDIYFKLKAKQQELQELSK